MKNVKHAIILGIIIVAMCLVGTIYATHENKMAIDSHNLEIEAPIEVAEPEHESSEVEAEIKVATMTAYTTAGFAVEVSIPAPPQRKVKQVPMEEMSEEKETSEDEVMVIEEEEIPEPSVITPVVRTYYNSKDGEYDDILNSYSDWDGDTSWFELLGSKYVTGYDACKSCCGKEVDDPNYGVTASTSHVKMGRTAAVNGLPFGAVIYIDGIGFRVVEDRGGMVNGNVDVFCDTHDECYAITGRYDVYLVWSPDWV